MGGIFEEVWGLAIFAYFFLQLFMGLRYRGRWLIAAMVPLVVMVPIVIHAALAFLAGSNLWPILIVLVAPLAFLYLLAVAAARAVATAR